MILPLSRLLVPLGLSAILLAAVPANAAMGDWVSGQAIVARLVATPDGNGAVVGAIELRLEPGWKTYWRTPGEGGLAPIFDFANSWNVADVEVGFPPPRRYDDSFAVANVYEGTVLFPLTMTVPVATAPGTLHVTMDLGVCDVVCIPIRLVATVIVPPGQVDEAALAVVNEARSLLPQPARAGFGVTEVVIEGVDGRLVDLAARAELPQAFGAELFVEAPGSWIPFVPHDVEATGTEAVFQFRLEKPADDTATTGVRLRLTTVSGGGAVEQWITLP